MEIGVRSVANVDDVNANSPALRPTITSGLSIVNSVIQCDNKSREGLTFNGKSHNKNKLTRKTEN